MTAPVDVLAVMARDAVQAVQYRVIKGENSFALATESDDARAAIAELIEAVKALQEAMDTPEKGPFDSLTVKQFHEADARHRAALIACGAALARVGGA